MSTTYYLLQQMDDYFWYSTEASYAGFTIRQSWALVRTAKGLSLL